MYITRKRNKGLHPIYKNTPKNSYKSRPSCNEKMYLPLKLGRLQDLELVNICWLLIDVNAPPPLRTAVVYTDSHVCFIIYLFFEYTDLFPE